MKIINQHLGLPVICLDTSERVGDVLRFVTDQVSGHIVAMAVTRQWYQEPGGIAFKDCTAFGQNVVLVSRRDAIQPLSTMDDARIHLEAANDARQRTAITESGRLLGTVTDEAFDETTGEVNGYRLDVMADTGAGRTVYIARAAFVTSSATVAILKDDVLKGAAARLEELSSEFRVPSSEGGGTDAPTVASAPSSPPEARNAEPATRDAPAGAWPGAEDYEFATPDEVADAGDDAAVARASTAPPLPPILAFPPSGGGAKPEPPPAPPSEGGAGAGARAGGVDSPVPLPERGPGGGGAATASQAVVEAQSLDAAAEEDAPRFRRPAFSPPPSTPSEEDALFADVADDDPLAAEEFPPETGDVPSGLAPLSEEGLAGDMAVEEDAAPAISEELRAATEGHIRVMMALTVGKTAGANVYGADGVLIATSGDTITQDIAQSAAQANKLYELWTTAQD